MACVANLAEWARATILLDRHGRGFSEGRHADLLGDYAFPHPVYLEDRLLVLARPADLLAAQTAYRRLLTFRRVTGVTPCLERVESRGKRARAWARWAHHGPDGTNPEGSRIVHYLGRASDGRTLIEMTEYTHLSVRDIKAWRPRAA